MQMAKSSTAKKRVLHITVTTSLGGWPSGGFPYKDIGNIGVVNQLVSHLRL